MKLPDGHLLLGMLLGAISATALATMGPGMVVQAFADASVGGIDPSRLVRFEERDYTVDYEDWVATDPLSTAMVKKIEGGKVSYVNITTTATGTYSTDAMFSKHVLYPGITVSQVPDERDYNRFSYWTNDGWTSFGTSNGKSFIYLRSGNATMYSRN
ncbi:hypothetical protein [Devosia sp. 2618]|uniref:hypothetical protein n=1 Tax=Devosia sp. 2618 TaxID=3156454 RepID=UPI003394B15B